ncbi:MAG: hypothetical protein MI975_07415 [Cytophagales bacterium]|nr:hypothetical protein [Cytophagales bacterium]
MKSTIPGIPVSSIIVADSINIQLHVLLGPDSLPDKYGARVITPVCETDKCYMIELDMYWDLIGRYLYFDTIPGKGLTKLDHKPFEERDYHKLGGILNDPNSPFVHYSKEELVENTRSSEIDGLTGATIQEIKEYAIGGAVYSCYTLWHITHGSVIDSLRKSTRSMFGADLVQKLVRKNDQMVNYYLIHSFSKEEFERFLPFVLETIHRGKGYYSKNAIEKIPAYLLNDDLAQDFFASNFAGLDYFSKVALLKKLYRDSLSENLKYALVSDLDRRNSLKNTLIRQLLSQETE